MAPSAMASSSNDKMQKSDSIDARRIASCLCFGQYKRVFVPTEEDEAVKEYIRMRNDTQTMRKQTKQKQGNDRRHALRTCNCISDKRKYPQVFTCGY